MLQDGRHESVVVAHDVEALDEGGTMVGCRRPFVEVERYGLGVERCGLGFLEYTDAPVDVGREAVAEIVVGRDASLSDEGLMTDEHPRAEATPVELVRRAQAS